MKINDSALVRQLTSKLLPAYWVSGDEPLLVQECLDLINRKLKLEGFSEKQVLNIDASFEPEQFYELTQNFSLFSEKTRLEIQLTDKFPEKFTATLLEVLNQSNPDLVIVIQSNKLSAAQMKTKWYLGFEKIGCHISVWPIEANQLSGWIQQRGKKLGLSFSNEALVALAEFCEGNLLAAKQALEKLSLSKPEGLVSLEEIEAFQADESRYNVFHLSSACLLGDAKKVWHILQHLKAENTEATVILWALTKELRLIATLHQESRFQAIDVLFKRYQVWDKRQPEVRRALSRLNYADCLKLIQQASQIDKMIKGVIKEDAWEALADFAMKFTKIFNFKAMLSNH
ncbi:MAG: polymerase delta subunit [Gammaproteobacteria bacterium]|jgi:DNA polymerase-3 subunit delta|nr:polymerase delta subunit [Gammaproteobacteria bacterium]